MSRGVRRIFGCVRLLRSSRLGAFLHAPPVRARRRCRRSSRHDHRVVACPRRCIRVRRARRAPPDGGPPSALRARRLPPKRLAVQRVGDRAGARVRPRVPRGARWAVDARAAQQVGVTAAAEVYGRRGLWRGDADHGATTTGPPVVVWGRVVFSPIPSRVVRRMGAIAA